MDVIYIYTHVSVLAGSELFVQVLDTPTVLSHGFVRYVPVTTRVYVNYTCGMRGRTMLTYQID